MTQKKSRYYRHTVCGRSLWRRKIGDGGRIETSTFYCRGCGRNVPGNSGEIEEYNMPKRPPMVLLNLSPADAAELHGHLKLADAEDDPALSRIIAKLEKQGVK